MAMLGTEGLTTRVLIVDDEKVVREGCARSLLSLGYTVDKAEDGAGGIALMERQDYDILLLDLMMPGVDGFGVLAWVKAHRPSLLVIVITGFATVAKAVAAMKEGAFDFVGKPFTPDYLRLVVQRAAEKQALMAEMSQLRAEKSLDLETIAEEQSRLKTVFACMEGAIVVTNHREVVVLHNPAATRLLEIQTHPIVGRTLSELIADPGAADMVRQVMTQASSITREFSPGSISGFYLRAHSAPVRAVDGKIQGSVTVFEDISFEKHIDQLKSEFVAMVVHELRAPLAAVEQMIYSLASGGEEMGERCQHLLGRVKARIRDQLQMINNLLDLSKLETGSVVLNLTPVRVEEILEEAIEIVLPRAKGKAIGLAFDPGQTDTWLQLDREQIRIVFTNILDNAIKYTPAGGQVAIAHAVAGGLVSVTITDTGVGISADDLPHIFDRFFRGRGSGTRDVSGSGLGLSLVKKIVEAHHGYIDVSANLGGGTTMTLSLPLFDAQPPRPAGDKASRVA